MCATSSPAQRRRWLLTLILLASSITLLVLLSAADSSQSSSADASNNLEALASSPYLVKDINQETEPSTPSHLIAISNTLFFFADDGLHGNELWKSDGTFDGTVWAGEIVPGPGGADPSELIDVNGALYFIHRTAPMDYATRELWKSDGTPQGTVRVAQPPRAYWDDDFDLTNVNGTVFFRGGGESTELWKSDGTPTGTVAIKTIGYYPDALTSFKDKLYFLQGASSSPTAALWESDGTPTGTVPVKSFYSSYSQPTATNAEGSTGFNPLVEVSGTLFFNVCHLSGWELWKSDGTTTGTLMVRGGYSGGTASPPSNLIGVNGSLFFSACDGSNGCELWKSDGTLTGTVLVKDIYSGTASSSPSNLTDVNGTLFFSACDDQHGCELWRSDGTEAGTTLVSDAWPGSPSSAPMNLTSMGSMLFFTADDGVHGRELWKSTGTPASTAMVTDILPGPVGSLPDDLTVMSDTLYFRADGGPHGAELWKTNGTPTGTLLVRDIRPQTASSSPSLGTQAGDASIFWADDGTGEALWASEGTPTGTALIANINTFVISIDPGHFANVNGTAFFAANGGPPYDRALWRSDGTPTGTMMIKDFPLDAEPYYLTEVNGAFFFLAHDDATGGDLWTSDGTPTGTVKVAHLFGLNFIDVNGELFFSTNGSGGISDPALWKSDGTPTGTVPIKILPLPVEGYWSKVVPNVVNGQLFFTIRTNFYRTRQLWKSDGTPTGTIPLKDFWLPDYNLPFYSVRFKNLLYFTGGNNSKYDAEIWKSDGIPDGTVFVLDSEPETGYSLWGIKSLTVVNDTLYFTAYYWFTEGRELWKTDGTAQGTQRVKDINIGPAGSNPQNLMAVFDTLYFTADDGLHGRELWQSDGTPEGTFMVADIYSGTLGSQPANLSLFTNRFHSTLFFQADDGEHGKELWALRVRTYDHQFYLPVIARGH